VAAFLLAGAAMPAAAHASGQPGAKPDVAEEAPLETVEVTANAERQIAARPESHLGGMNLRRQIANSLGKTLEQQPGVNNASFGPGVGIPVIRGLTGARIRVLQDGIGSNDAAAVSPDHALSIEPLLAEDITVVRGPATIRYGSGALGGVVEVRDGRIPDGPPPDGTAGAAELRYTDNADEFAGVGKLDAGKGIYALHLDGFYRTRNDLAIPGYAIDQSAVEQQFGLVVPPGPRGYVPNSDLTTGGGTVGGSVSGDLGLVGMAANFLENNYGIPPGGHGQGHSHGDGRVHGENVRVDLSQARYDFKAEWFDPLKYLDKAALRIGLVDYEHSEVDAGVRSTTFRNEVLEGRFELPFHVGSRFDGSAGLHWMDRDFSATGLETFVPPTHIAMVAGYANQRVRFERFDLEFGIRQETQATSPDQRSHSVGGLYEVPLPGELSYAPLSLSGALAWRVAAGLEARLQFNRAERAPDVQELLSLGPHLATRSFDVGNVGLTVETARDLDLGLAWRGRWAEAKVNGFYNPMLNYIYLANQDYFFDAEAQRFQLRCAELDRCLPVYGYSQADATFAGYEAQASVLLPELPWGVPSVTIFSDYVRGRFDAADLGDVPRLPPLRYGGQIGFEGSAFNAAVRLTRGQPQDHPGNNETPTAGYIQLYANFSYQWKFADRYRLTAFLRGDNLLNQEIRNSVSFLRNFAPEPGRSIEIGLRGSF
jgi:iron complex outermembrane receptor protein